MFPQRSVPELYFWDFTASQGLFIAPSLISPRPDFHLSHVHCFFSYSVTYSCFISVFKTTTFGSKTFCSGFTRSPSTPTHPLPSPSISPLFFLYLLLLSATLYWNSREAHPPCLFIFSLFLPLICLSCVTTSICLSLLAVVCDNNSVIHSRGKTLKRRLFPLLSQSIHWLYWQDCLSETILPKQTSKWATGASM